MTARQIADKMHKRSEKLLPHLTSVTKGLSVAALKLSKENLNQIYAIPEEVNPKTGKKKWKRTGHLKRSQVPPVITGPTSFEIRNTAVYAAARHEYGKPETAAQKAKREAKGKTKPRGFNPLRVNHWQEDMFKVMNPICQEQWREAVLDVLRGEGI